MRCLLHTSSFAHWYCSLENWSLFPAAMGNVWYWAGHYFLQRWEMCGIGLVIISCSNGKCVVLGWSLFPAAMGNVWYWAGHYFLQQWKMCGIGLVIISYSDGKCVVLGWSLFPAAMGKCVVLGWSLFPTAMGNVWYWAAFVTGAFGKVAAWSQRL